MSITAKSFLFKLASTMVPLASSLLFGYTGLALSGLAVFVVAFLISREEETHDTLKVKALTNLFGYATFGAVLSGLWLVFVV